LVEAGFGYVTVIDGAMVFRKRKWSVQVFARVLAISVRVYRKDRFSRILL
jgi:hypothetical protein